MLVPSASKPWQLEQCATNSWRPGGDLVGRETAGLPRQLGAGGAAGDRGGGVGARSRPEDAGDEQEEAGRAEQQHDTGPEAGPVGQRMKKIVAHNPIQTTSTKCQ